MTKDKALRMALDWYDSGHEDREEFKAMMENLLVAPAAQRQWVKLTDEEIVKIIVPFPFLMNTETERWLVGFARAIEAAHGITGENK